MDRRLWTYKPSLQRDGRRICIVKFRAVAYLNEIWTLGQLVESKWGKESERVFRKLWMLMTRMLLMTRR